MIWNVEECESTANAGQLRSSSAVPENFVALTKSYGPPDNQPKDWPTRSSWARVLNDINFSLDDGHNRFRSGLQWREVFEKQVADEEGASSDGQPQLPLFSYPLGDAKIPWTVWLSEEALWSRYNTLSHIARLDGEAKEKVLRVFKDAMKGDDVERNEGGEVAVHGNTYLAWTTRMWAE